MVYQLSIGAACGLSWPSDRIVIQVLDDSTDPFIKEMVEIECQKWASKGINIHYQVRDNRKGYKAGALKEGLKHRYANECEYVAIFDADFQPEPDFLWQTIPFLHHNSELGLVQARWKFGNYSSETHINDYLYFFHQLNSWFMILQRIMF
ncbi:putative glucomannan 4-beta-mannosyltransferase [Helianthus debilis subsp. tardiflorus]